MRPRVSFLIPCYNYARFLPDCLNSIFAQECSADFEVIVIDDGSTDNTQEVIRSFADPRLRQIRHATNLGHAATVNEGLSECRGDFIARIDPDDRYRSHFLSAVLPHFETHPDVGVVYGDAAVIDQNGTLCEDRSDRVHNGADHIGNELVALLEQNFICAPTLIARKGIWLSAGPVPMWLAFNDWYFNVMMARQTDFYFTNSVVAEYRVHPANHHARIIRDRTEEPSIFWLLDRIYAETEKMPVVEEAKRRRRRRIYSAQYLTLANKYLGYGMSGDARRCYLAAMRYWPGCATDFAVLHRLVGSLLGRRLYEHAKTLAKALP